MIMVELIQPGQTQSVTVPLAEVMAGLRAANQAGSQPNSLEGMLLQLSILEGLNSQLLQEAARNSASLRNLANLLDITQKRKEALETARNNEPDQAKKDALTAQITALQTDCNQIGGVMMQLANRNVEVRNAIRANVQVIKEMLTRFGLNIVRMAPNIHV